MCVTLWVCTTLSIHSFGVRVYQIIYIEKLNTHEAPSFFTSHSCLKESYYHNFYFCAYVVPYVHSSVFQKCFQHVLPDTSLALFFLSSDVVPLHFKELVNVSIIVTVEKFLGGHASLYPPLFQCGQSKNFS